MHLHHQNSTLKTKSLIYYKCASQLFIIYYTNHVRPHTSALNMTLRAADSQYKAPAAAQAEASSSCRSMGKIDRRTDGETPDH